MTKREFLALNDDVPILACQLGVSQHPGYRKCSSCLYTQQCDLYAYENAQLITDNLFQQWFNQSVENKFRYYQLDGHWFAGDGSNVKKNSALDDSSRKFCCSTGLAIHPKYHKCQDCPVSDCELGLFIAQKHQLDKKNPSAFVRFFEKIADLFDSIFRK